MSKFCSKKSLLKTVFTAFCPNRILKEEKPDVVHLHSSKAGIIGRIAANSKMSKVIYNPHGFSFLMEDASKIKKKIYWFIEKIATLRKCTIVGCSQGEYQEAKKLTKNSVCINNGINTKELLKQTKQINFSNKNELTACTVARINYQKNPDLFNEISTKFPQINFTWIGDGELREKIYSSNIRVTGWLSRLDVLNEMQKNDIFILTSLWEGLPISLLEAMYMQRICIVTDVIGNRDVIKNGINGFVCNNITEFSDVINNIIEGKYNIESIKKSAREDVEKYYDFNIYKRR